MQAYYLLSSTDGLYELHSSIPKVIDKITSRESQKDTEERIQIKQFLTYFNEYQKKFKNKGVFLLSFYLLGYTNESIESIMEKYSKEIGLTGFNYEEMKTVLHQFVFHETLKHKILPSNFKKTLENFYVTFSNEDYNMTKIIDFVEKTYTKSEDKEKLDKLADLFYDDLSDRVLNLIQNTNILFTALLAKMQKTLEEGKQNVDLYQHDIYETIKHDGFSEFEDAEFLDITNYHIEKIPFMG